MNSSSAKHCPGERSAPKHLAGSGSMRRRVLSRIRRAFNRHVDPPFPSASEVEKAIEKEAAYFASIPPEVLDAFREYRGPVVLGRGGPKRRDLDERR
jgi:hypothetical protein